MKICKVKYIVIYNFKYTERNKEKILNVNLLFCVTEMVHLKRQ